MLHFVIGTYSLRFEKQKLREKYIFFTDFKVYMLN